MTVSVPIKDEDQAFIDATGIQEFPGWLGCYTTRNAPGALPAGTRVTKALDEPGDTHHIGDEGTVLGSIAMPEGEVFVTPFGPVKIFLFVEWDSDPKVAVGIIDVKIRRTSNGADADTAS
jgi:hypothetical protein